MKKTSRQRIAREAETCAVEMFLELTGGAPRPELWYRWFLCERHGGAPLVDPLMPSGQIAYWDGEDIIVDGRAPIAEVVKALPEELAHRLSSRETARFERLNALLRSARTIERSAFQEMVGQRVAELFSQPSAFPSETLLDD